MNQSSYSFLDFTVMPFLRKRVISADAAVLFTRNLDHVLWANAIGTRLFGGEAVIDLLDAGLPKNHPLVRQLRHASAQVTADEPVVRSFQISHGLKTENVRAEISVVTLPDDSEAILLVSPQSDFSRRYREYELAEMSVESLEGFADASAIIDEYGLILSSSSDFDAYEIDPGTLETLVNMVAREDDRLVKRPILNADGETIAAGLGRIRDLPARFLVVLASADAASADDDGDISDFASNDPDAMSGYIVETDISRDEIDDDDLFEAVQETEADSDDDESIPPWMDTDNEEAQEAEVTTTSVDEVEPDDEVEATNGQVEDAEKSDFNLPSSGSGSLLDRWYFADDENANAGSPEAANAEDTEEPEETARVQDDSRQDEPSDLPDTQKTETTESAQPVRFAFTIDEDRIIRSASPELADAVGPRSGNIIGQRWEEVASERGFDTNGVISALLAKADTWSGKSVLWPVDQTDMVVPVDLAALPVFDKERRFDGFRGFGIIRMADAIVDPEGKGFTLGLGGGKPAEDIIDDDSAESFGGWRADLSSEEHASSREEPAKADVPSGEYENTIDERPGIEEAPLADKGNIFHLPNLRTSRGDPRDRLAEDPGAKDHHRNFDASADEEKFPEDEASPGHDKSHETMETPELNGREKRAFKEIRRTLTGKDEEEPAPLAAFSKAETGAAGADVDNAREGEATRVLPGEAESVLAGLPVPLLVYENGHTLFANEALLEETGYASLEELHEAGGVDALLAGNERISGASICHKDGTVMAVNSRLTKVNWQGRTALCLTFEPADQQDVSAFASATGDSKTALDMMRVAELENILDTAADGLLVIDADGRIESLNTSGEALFGFDQDDVVGKPVTRLFATESHEVLVRHLEELKSPGVTGVLNQGHEVIGLEANGGMIPLFAMIGKVGSSGRFCAVLRDLTEWKKTEEELVEAKRKAETANDQKSEFLSRVSHEIREPLTSIIGFSDVMIEERFGKIENPRYREYLRDINRSGIHVLDLVNDLLDISKIEAGKLELSYEAVELNQLAAETVALLQPKANNKRIIIRTSLSRAVPKVVADARSIRQIILNLVSNAIQHSDRNSQVIVSTTFEENGEVALRVRDTGRGMSESELKRALEPFAQVGEDRLQNASGTGLGLPLTKALVEANRAYFELESVKGEGTIAHIQFPSQRVLAD